MEGRTLRWAKVSQKSAAWEGQWAKNSPQRAQGITEGSGCQAYLEKARPPWVSLSDKREPGAPMTKR